MVEPWLFLEPCWNGKKNENKAGLPKAMPQRQCSGLGLNALPQATVLNLVQKLNISFYLYVHPRFYGTLSDSAKPENLEKAGASPRNPQCTIANNILFYKKNII